MLAAVAVILRNESESVNFKHFNTRAMLQLVSSHLMVTSWPKSKSYSLTWAIKMAATASYRAVPSMLMVAPTGSTKRAICRSTPQFSRRHFMVIGNVAELRKQKRSKVEKNV